MLLKILHLYPDLLTLETGNIIVLAQRAKWRGIEVQVNEARQSEAWQLENSDLVFMGSGTAEAQTAVAQDWTDKTAALHEAVEHGLTVLAIAAGYELLGTTIQTAGGNMIPGAGIFPMVTKIKPHRLEGPIAIQISFLRSQQPVVGYENHRGHTQLAALPSTTAQENTIAPLGRVIYGQGNNGQDQTEGARYKNALGTYIQGPVLAQNPHLADFLLEQALSRRYGQVRLSPLDDRLENRANQEFFNQQRPHPLTRLLFSRRR